MGTLTRAILWASIVPLRASCTIPREITRTARSAIEQLLLAEAVNNAKHFFATSDSATRFVF